MQGTNQLVWLQHLLGDIGFKQTTPTSLCSDNLGAITLSNDSTYHTYTKNINIAYHFICKRITFHEAMLTYIQLKENLVDIIEGA